MRECPWSRADIPDTQAGATHGNAFYGLLQGSALTLGDNLFEAC